MRARTIVNTKGSHAQVVNLILCSSPIRKERERTYSEIILDRLLLNVLENCTVILSTFHLSLLASKIHISPTISEMQQREMIVAELHVCSRTSIVLVNCIG